MERKAKEMVTHEGEENEDAGDNTVASSSTNNNGISNGQLLAKAEIILLFHECTASTNSCPKETTSKTTTTTKPRKRKKLWAELEACNAAAMAIFKNLKQMEENQVHAGVKLLLNYCSYMCNILVRQ